MLRSRENMGFVNNALSRRGEKESGQGVMEELILVGVVCGKASSTGRGETTRDAGKARDRAGMYLSKEEKQGSPQKACGIRWGGPVSHIKVDARL